MDAGLPRSQPPSKFLGLPRPKPLLRVAGNQLRARLGELEHRIVQSPPIGQRVMVVEPGLDFVEARPASEVGRPSGTHHALRQTGGQFLQDFFHRKVKSPTRGNHQPNRQPVEGSLKSLRVDEPRVTQAAAGVQHPVEVEKQYG